ncbi:MAG: anaerobic benzoate catabolism transcriptional regulator [Spirochaetes bacterium ADurb.Bin269]|nr:MAG: anaerobic benzoate catabolism transcriptional regulator [Spirochaetes bacterium ADurb.Bin269]
MNGKKTIIRLLDKRFAGIDSELLKKPPQGWIRTIREALGMTSTQLERRMGLSQPRIIQMEKNVKNLKIATLEKAATALGCRLVYALVPNEPIEEKLRDRAREKAAALTRKVHINMALENQQVNSTAQIDELASELLAGPLRNL